MKICCQEMGISSCSRQRKKQNDMGILCKVILNIWTRYKDLCDITGSKQTKSETFLVRVYLYLDLKYTAEKNVRIRGYSGLHFPALELNMKRQSISPYSIRMRENTDQNNSDYGHFSRVSPYFIFVIVGEHEISSYFFKVFLIQILI